VAAWATARPCFTDVPILALEGEVGPAAVIALQRRIARALDGGHRRIVLDLGATTILGGPTLGLLCGTLRFVNRCGATLAIAGSPARVQRAIDLCDLDRVEFHPTVHTALAAEATPTSLLTESNHHRRASATTKGRGQHA
jgi:anti-sigma B factor antagonist